jgi:hypothetical protein
VQPCSFLEAFFFSRYLKDLPIQKEQGTKSLILRGRGDLSIDSQVGKKFLNFAASHLSWMLHLVKPDVPPNPVEVSIFGSDRVVLEPNFVPHFVYQRFWTLWHLLSRFLF